MGEPWTDRPKKLNVKFGSPTKKLPFIYQIVFKKRLFLYQIVFKRHHFRYQIVFKKQTKNYKDVRSKQTLSSLWVTECLITNIVQYAINAVIINIGIKLYTALNLRFLNVANATHVIAPIGLCPPLQVPPLRGVAWFSPPRGHFKMLNNLLH
jgi:hypothetical protein